MVVNSLVLSKFLWCRFWSWNQTGVHPSGISVIPPIRPQPFSVWSRLLLPARALMRERSNRRAELFSLSQSSESHRLLTPSLYCCWISMCSNSAATDVILTSPRLLCRCRHCQVLPPAACSWDLQTTPRPPPRNSSTNCRDKMRELELQHRKCRRCKEVN